MVESTLDLIAGIDLGTTYSCLAVVDETGKPVVVKNREGHATTPSVVLFDAPDSVVVGDAAKNAMAQAPDRVVAFVKRQMGKPEFPGYEFDGRKYAPEEVSARILKKIVADAEEQLGRKIEKAVVTVPAYFGENERNATRAAGRIAGLDVVAILDEPSAAAFSYGVARAGKETLLAYDLGGGTFDITLVRVEDGDVRVLAKEGAHELGGKDWDDRIVAYGVSKWAEAQGKTVDEANALLDEGARNELRAAAEVAKRDLSTRKSTFFPVLIGADRVRVDLTQETFNQITSDLLQQASDLVDKLLRDAKELGAPDFDRILMVGGSTRMPQVTDSLKRHGREPQLFDPDEAVAKGAALYAQILALKPRFEDLAEENVRKGMSPEKAQEAAKAQLAREANMPLQTLVGKLETELVSVTSRCFGVVALDATKTRRVAFLIPRNEPVPVERKMTFGTERDSQHSVLLEVMEGTDEDVVDPTLSVLIGETELADIPRLPAGSPIEVTFRMDADGLLTATGREPTSGKSITAQFRRETGLTEREIQEKAKGLEMTKVG